MSLNKVMLIGNVGMDPEVRYLDGGGAPGTQTKVASFRLATTERYKDRSGELKENTEWHSVVAWRSTADVVEKFVKKGTQLYIEGRLRTREYTDQTGAKRYRTEITADTLQLLGRRSDNPGAEGGPFAGSASGPSYAAPAPTMGYGAPAQAYGAAPAGSNAGFPSPATAAPAATPGPMPIDNPDDDLPF